MALSETDCRVADPLRLIRRIYRVEELANLRRLTPEERGELRRKRTKPALDTLKRWLIETAAQEPPASDLAKAAAYSLNHWTALTRFLEDGRLAPDNNLCEQQLRGIALGRKNSFSSAQRLPRRTPCCSTVLRPPAHATACRHCRT